MILAMEIVWFVSFWCCSMSFAKKLLSLIKECKGFNGGQHEKISIGFRTDEVCWFLVKFLSFFLLGDVCYIDECT